jgi:glutathione S-transferase
MTYTLWGSAPSLYTGKARAYLIKKGLDWRERNPGDPEFAARILPVVRHFVIPVLEAPDDTFVQDSGDIIDWLEARHPEHPLDPTTPVQRAVSLLFDAIGSEFLLPHAMHYRWSVRADQEDFLASEFGRTLVVGGNPVERRAMASRAMATFAGTLPGLGVNDSTIPAIEESYHEWLAVLDTHFHYHPYLLGGRPCRGDFGMMASLYAHLGRDPVPAGIMRRIAPNVARWTERMNLTPITDGEFPGHADGYPADDAIPATLEPVIALAWRDWTPSLIADAACFNAWTVDRPGATAVSLDGSRRVHPSLGSVVHQWRGVAIDRRSAVHALWMFAAIKAVAEAMDADSRARFDALLDRTDGTATMALALARPMRRDDNILVLA